MEPSFIYEAKGRTLVIHLPRELDHHNCRNLKYETDLLMAENYISRILFDFTGTELHGQLRYRHPAEPVQGGEGPAAGRPVFTEQVPRYFGC